MENRWDEKGVLPLVARNDVSVLASGKGRVFAGLAMLAVHGSAWLRAALQALPCAAPADPRVAWLWAHVWVRRGS